MRPPEESENFQYEGASTEAISAQVIEAHTKGERIDYLKAIDPPNLKIVEAPKGSLVVWHGNTWHGAVPRSEPGLRANLIYYWCTAALLPQEPYRARLEEAILESWGAEFAKLIGKNIFNGWMAEGPEFMLPGRAFEREREATRNP